MISFNISFSQLLYVAFQKSSQIISDNVFRVLDRNFEFAPLYSYTPQFKNYVATLFFSIFWLKRQNLAEFISQNKSLDEY